MRSKRNRDAVDTMRSEEYTVDPFNFDIDELKSCKEFVLRSISELAESELGVLHPPQGDAQRLYLITGGVFSLGDSGVTRLN
jgi:hypothetical protein